MNFKSRRTVNVGHNSDFDASSLDPCIVNVAVQLSLSQVTYLGGQASAAEKEKSLTAAFFISSVP